MNNFNEQAPVLFVALSGGGKAAGVFFLVVRVLQIPVKTIAQPVGKLLLAYSGRFGEWRNRELVALVFSLYGFLAPFAFVVYFLDAEFWVELVFGAAWGGAAVYVKLLLPAFVARIGGALLMPTMSRQRTAPLVLRFQTAYLVMVFMAGTYVYLGGLGVRDFVFLYSVAATAVWTLFIVAALVRLGHTLRSVLDSVAKPVLLGALPLSMVYALVVAQPEAWPAIRWANVFGVVFVGLWYVAGVAMYYRRLADALGQAHDQSLPG